jgi:hypothetical protein
VEAHDYVSRFVAILARKAAERTEALLDRVNGAAGFNPKRTLIVGLLSERPGGTHDDAIQPDATLPMFQ